MNDDTEFIAALDDATAQRLLTTVARARLRNGATLLEPSAELGRAISDQLDIATPAEVEPASEGEIARLALQLLAEDPSTREVIVALGSAPAPESFSFDAGTTVALSALVLVALQTHFRFHRDKTGKWSLTLEKKPTKDSLLKPLVQKLLSLFPSK